MKRLSFGVNSPTTSSGYGSEEDHSLSFLFPAEQQHHPSGGSGSGGGDDVFGCCSCSPFSPSSDSGGPSLSRSASDLSASFPFKEGFSPESLEEIFGDSDFSSTFPSLDLTGWGARDGETDSSGVLGPMGDYIGWGGDSSDDREPFCDSNDTGISPTMTNLNREPVDTLSNDYSDSVTVISTTGNEQSTENRVFEAGTIATMINSADSAFQTGVSDESQSIPEEAEMQHRCNHDNGCNLSSTTSPLSELKRNTSSEQFRINSEQNPVDTTSAEVISSPESSNRDEETARNQCKSGTDKWSTENQRRYSGIRYEADQSTDKRPRMRRSHSELDDHRYSSPIPLDHNLPPSKIPRISLTSTGHRARRLEKSILETFLLTKETLHANKGSEGVLAESNIARLYTGFGQNPADQPPKSQFPSPNYSTLEALLTKDSDTTNGDRSNSVQCSSVEFPTDSLDGKARIEATPSESSEIGISGEIFVDNCRFDCNSMQLEFLCENFDDGGWTPSGDSGKVFSSEMDAIINGQKPNQTDIWIHQYISDLL